MPEDDAPGSPESCIPVVDLRALDQDELMRLADSQLQVSLELVDVAINRRVFNESKEPTFSPAPPDRRHRRLAASSSSNGRGDANGGKAMNLAEEVELTRHLAQLHGSWVSTRRREKIIAAKGFPPGWTVRVGLCFRDGRWFLNYQNYTSPEGKSWPTFKSAAAYLVTELCPSLKNSNNNNNNKLLESQQTQQAEENPGSKATGEQPESQGSGSENSEKPVRWTKRGFECTSCGKSFRTKAKCVRHQASHVSSATKRKRGEIAQAPEESMVQIEIQSSEDNNNNNKLEYEKIDVVVVEQRKNDDEEQQQQQEVQVRSSSEPEAEPEPESCQVCKKMVLENPVYCSWCEREYHPGCVRAPIQRDWTCVVCNFVA